jgi:hypothetical protein
MKSPVAWIPSTVAAARLREIARSLKIFNNGLRLVKTLQGTQLITGQPPPVNNFPVSFSPQTRSIEVPGIYVDFATWQYLPPSVFSGGPSPSADVWLRLVLPVTYDVGDFWDTLDVDAPFLEWVTHEDGVTSPSGNGFVPSDTEDEFYAYLLRITNYQVTVHVTSALLRGFPS